MGVADRQTSDAARDSESERRKLKRRDEGVTLHLMSGKRMMEYIDYRDIGS